MLMSTKPCRYISSSGNLSSGNQGASTFQGLIALRVVIYLGLHFDPVIGELKTPEL